MPQTPNLAPLLQVFSAANATAASRCLRAMWSLKASGEVVERFAQRLSAATKSLPDATLVSNTNPVLERLANLISAAPGESSEERAAWLSALDGDERVLQRLVQILAVSPYLTDQLRVNPAITLSLPQWLAADVDWKVVDRQRLASELLEAIECSRDSRTAAQTLAQFRQRESARIAYAELFHDLSTQHASEQLTMLAEIVLTAALRFARVNSGEAPVQPDGSLIEFSIFAIGELGGRELDYACDLELIFIREAVQPSPAWQRNLNDEISIDGYFQRIGQLIVQLLENHGQASRAYSVDLKLRPHGEQGPLVADFRDAIGYYDLLGRTWERQAFTKVRCVAGDRALDEALIDELQSWIYRRYLMRADITGLAALKRRIERQAVQVVADAGDVVHGRGGIHEVEKVVQFLQLLHGSQQPQLRCANTLESLRQLSLAGHLSPQDQTQISDSYRYMRTVVHHMQLLQGLDACSLPSDSKTLDRIARRLTNFASDASSADFLPALTALCEQNHVILAGLLRDSFADYEDEQRDTSGPEADLILDPEPSAEVIARTLEPYGFANVQAAYEHLQSLAAESLAFLSTRRSRHFLAAIAPDLLAAIAATPTPDETLRSLTKVSDSLGGKAVLWELFSATPASMELCVNLCATSPYLASILTSNPGMIDELLDSLMLGSLPTQEQLSAELAALCRGATDITMILHRFKNSMHLRVGVRDILGKSTIAQTHAALSDIAEVCMEQVIFHEFHRLVHQFGLPVCADEQGAEQPAELIVLAVGKLGGREPNYHSDLDVIFLFDGEGSTRSLLPSRRFEPTSNRHFFNQLTQRVIQAATHVGATGTLYDLDVSLRPLGRTGHLVISVDELKLHYADGHGKIWERQALCKARPIWGSTHAREAAMQAVSEALQQRLDGHELARQVYELRSELQTGSSAGNLKRGHGGTMDIEFVVQLLQLVHIPDHPALQIPGTVEAILRLRDAGILDANLADEMHCNYEFLRCIESGIRLMDSAGRHEFPSQPIELERLAFLLKSENRFDFDSQRLAVQCQLVRDACRRIYRSLMSRWLPGCATPER